MYRIKNEQDVLPLEVAANDKVKKVIEIAAAKKAEVSLGNRVL